jgi:hypothetical protein
MGLPESARFEIDYRLAAKEQQFESALVLAAGLRFEALADDGLVTDRQRVKLTTIAANRGAEQVTVRRVTVKGLEGAVQPCGQGSLKPEAILSCESDLTVPAGLPMTGVYWKRLADAARYEFEPGVPFGAPFRPTPFTASFEIDVAGAPAVVTLPVLHRYQGDIFAGEKRMELKVVPRLALRATPGIAVLPLAEVRTPGRDRTADTGSTAMQGAREVRVTVTNNCKGAASGDVALMLPSGWTATPARAPIVLTREDEEQTVRFRIRPPADAPAGEYRIKAVATAGQERFDRGYQVVEYPHIRRRHLITSPEPVVKVIDVKVAPDLLVGYIMGVGDQVPTAIEQLGARLELVGSDELAWGDLSRYNVIVTGVRAYERRDDLRAHNDRLIKYAEAGGTVIVQYNKFEFNEAQYGPFPAKVSSNRVTDEASPVRLLAPEHPIFNSPNRVAEVAWRGWVQERGLYFLGEKDSRYSDLIEMEDTFEYNKGAKRGSLVEARVGKGRWIYVGLGLWRQLPAGTDGAYPLLANLLSLGSAKPAPATQAFR